MNKSFEETINQSLKIKNNLRFMGHDVSKIITKIHQCLKKRNKLLICGNGGSAADAQHLAAEFLIRLNPKINRIPFPVLNLAQDTSTITACGNDLGFENIFLRNLMAFGKSGDILLVLSTSGNSKNILKALKFAKKKKIISVGLLGNKGGLAKKYCAHSLVVPHQNVARIQECHIFLGHFIFNEIEKLMIKKK